jgi:hypothetical protein
MHFYCFCKRHVFVNVKYVFVLEYVQLISLITVPISDLLQPETSMSPQIRRVININMERTPKITIFSPRTYKGMVRSDMSKPALIYFFHYKSTNNKIHCQNSSC